MSKKYAYCHGVKTCQHKFKEDYIYTIKKNSNCTESEAIKIYDNLFKIVSNSCVIVDYCKKLILHKYENGVVYWHPYIEKALIFKDYNECIKFKSQIDWIKNGYDIKDCDGCKTPFRILVASVSGLTRKNAYPFRAKTGIKFQIEDKTKGN